MLAFYAGHGIRCFLADAAVEFAWVGIAAYSACRLPRLSVSADGGALHREWVWQGLNLQPTDSKSVALGQFELHTHKGDAQGLAPLNVPALRDYWWRSDCHSDSPFAWIEHIKSASRDSLPTPFVQRVGIPIFRLKRLSKSIFDLIAIESCFIESERPSGITPNDLPLSSQSLENGVDEGERIHDSIKCVAPTLEGVSDLRGGHRLSGSLIDYRSHKVSPCNFSTQLLPQSVLQSNLRGLQLRNFGVEQIALSSFGRDLRSNLKQSFVEFISHGYSR